MTKTPRSLKTFLYVLLGIMTVGILAYAAYVYLMPSTDSLRLDVTESRSETEIEKNVIRSGDEARGYEDFTSYAYKRVGNQVYINTMDPAVWKPLAADAATFVVLREGDEATDAYAKDKNQVYVWGEVLAQADPKTFTILNDMTRTGYFAADSDGFYIGTSLLSVPDALSYTMAHPDARSSGHAMFLKKGSSLYKLSYDVNSSGPNGYTYLLRAPTLVTGGDPSTFAPVPWDADDPAMERAYFNGVGEIVFFKDKNQVYCAGKVLVGADASTFRFVYESSMHREFGNNVRIVDKNYQYLETCEILDKK